MDMVGEVINMIRKVMDMVREGAKGKPNPTWNIWNTWNIQNTTNIFVYIFEYSENSSPNN